MWCPRYMMFYFVLCTLNLIVKNAFEVKGKKYSVAMPRRWIGDKIPRE